MLAMDIPISVMSGMLLAEGGKGLILDEGKNSKLLLRFITLAYAAIFIFPTPVYYFLGWPSWEINYAGSWADHIADVPIKAAFSYVLLACAVLPTWLGLEIGMSLIKKGKDQLNRIIYLLLFVLTGLIILSLYKETFNVASTYEKYNAGDTYSLWRTDFITGIGLTYVYFWGSLAVFYFWLKKKF